MLSTFHVEIDCPECNSNQKHSINAIIDGENDKETKTLLLNRELNILECSKCGLKGFYEYPILYFDKSKRLMIWYFNGKLTPHDTEISLNFPIGNLTKQPYNLRITNTYDELCEKIKIFDSNLNEIKVEYFKVIFRDQRVKNGDHNLTEIYFNGMKTNSKSESVFQFIILIDEIYKGIMIPLEMFHGIVEGCGKDDDVIKSIPMNEWTIVDKFFISGINPYDNIEYGYALSGTDFEYKGAFNSGDKNGKGVYIYPKGEIFIGECKNGEPNGFGTLSALSNEKYIGTIFNHRFSGHGKYIHYDGTIYEGEFKDDVYHGQGTLTKPDGTKYSGYWYHGYLADEYIGLNPYFHKETGVSFPLQLSGMDRVKVSNWTLTQPHLGFSVGYNFQQNINGTIYLYPSISSEEIQNEELLDQYKNVIYEVYRAYEKGYYDAVVKIKEDTECFPLKNDLYEMMFSVFLLSRDGTEAHSYLYLGALNNYFVKIRFTYDEDYKELGDNLREQFVADTVALIFSIDKEQIL